MINRDVGVELEIPGFDEQSFAGLDSSAQELLDQALSQADLNDAFFKTSAETGEILRSAGLDQTDALGSFVFGQDLDGRDTPEVDEEDFEPEELPFFRKLRSHMRELMYRATPEDKRYVRLRWMMCPIPDSDGVTFDDACKALRCPRPSIVRTRALYHMWQNGIEINRSLPPLHVPLPEFLVDEIEMRPSFFQLRKSILPVAKIIWANPGRSLSFLLDRFSEQNIENVAKSLDLLEVEGFVGKTFSTKELWEDDPEKEFIPRYYFISRNPSTFNLRRRNNFSWAKSMDLASY